jgi:hypothetical protein
VASGQLPRAGIPSAPLRRRVVSRRRPGHGAGRAPPRVRRVRGAPPRLTDAGEQLVVAAAGGSCGGGVVPAGGGGVLTVPGCWHGNLVGQGGWGRGGGVAAAGAVEHIVPPGIGCCLVGELLADAGLEGGGGGLGGGGLVAAGYALPADHDALQALRNIGGLATGGLDPALVVLVPKALFRCPSPVDSCHLAAQCRIKTVFGFGWFVRLVRFALRIVRRTVSAGYRRARRL